MTSFTKSKGHHNETNQQSTIEILSVLKVVRIDMHAKFQAIPSMRSLGNGSKPQI